MRWVSWAKKFHPTFLSFHVLSDGLSAAALGNLVFRNVLCVPNVGHVRAAHFKRPVFLLPALIHGLGLLLACFTPRTYWFEVHSILFRGRFGWNCGWPDCTFGRLNLR